MTRKEEQNIDELFTGLDGLYKKDPQEFEKRRLQIIEQTINSFPEEYRQRAQGLQFTIDCQLRRYKDPIMRMNKMVEIFWENFAQFQEAMTDPEKILRERRAERSMAKIIPLHRVKDSDHPSKLKH